LIGDELWGFRVELEETVDGLEEMGLCTNGGAMIGMGLIKLPPLILSFLGIFLQDLDLGDLELST
jgi:hypothetical protein